MVDLCIVGSADVVRDRHAAILKELSDKIRVRCIVSKRQEAVDVIQKHIGYPIMRLATLDEAIKTGINAALVTVTPSSTIEVASYVGRLKIPQYVEKPLGEDVISAAKFIEEVTKNSIPVVVGENFQHQERFRVGRDMIEACGHKNLTHVIIKDTLRRGLRTNPRTDDELFREQFVHLTSSIRALTGEEIKTITSAAKRAVGSVTEYVITGELSNGAYVEMHLSLTNTWSEDRYSLMFNDADIRISHTYSYDKLRYTDTVEHWHGPEELVKVVNIVDADCGMRKCWSEFLDLMQQEKPKPSPSLVHALHDVQVREAVGIALATGSAVPIPIVKFSTQKSWKA